MDVDSSSQEEASAVQVYWMPNLGCNLRVDLNTGVPEYHNYLKSASWITRRALRTVGDGGEVVYAKQRSRVFPENAPVASLKIKPENVPRHPGTPGRHSILPTWGESCDGPFGGTVGLPVPRQALRGEPPWESYSPAEPRLEVRVPPMFPRLSR